jgi:hypothetical protein
MDANTYGGGSTLKKNKGKQLLEPFVQYSVHEMGGWEQKSTFAADKSADSAASESDSAASESDSATMMTTWLGLTPDPHFHTTNNGRTYLQPQLNKAMRKEHVSESGDQNLKDFILFQRHSWRCQDPYRDNTGHLEYVQDRVYPTNEWPSDHCAISCMLERVTSTKEEKRRRSDGDL